MSITIRRDDSLMVREVDGELVVLDTSSNLVHQFNRTAALIWRLCAAASPPEAMADALVEAFDVERQTALRDVAETMAKLRSLNLLADAP